VKEKINKGEPIVEEAVDNKESADPNLGSNKESTEEIKSPIEQLGIIESNILTLKNRINTEKTNLKSSREKLGLPVTEESSASLGGLNSDLEKLLNKRRELLNSALNQYQAEYDRSKMEVIHQSEKEKHENMMRGFARSATETLELDLYSLAKSFDERFSLRGGRSGDGEGAIKIRSEKIPNYLDIITKAFKKVAKEKVSKLYKKENYLNESKKLTSNEQKIVMDNTVIDSGVLYPTAWHSKSGTLYVTNINTNKQPGFYADRMYILKHNGKEILKTKDHGSIVHKYSRMLLNELKPIGV